MALTKKFLRTLGIDDDKADEIMNGHAESINALKDERDRYQAESEKYKADAERLVEVQKKADELQKSIDEQKSDGFKEKYEAQKKEFEEYKAAQEQKETASKIKDAYTKLLKDAGISEKRIETVLKVTDLSAVKLDNDGKLEGEEELSKSIKTEWEDFIETKSEEGAKAATPPVNGEPKPGNGGRAAELEAMYHNERYGVTKEDK